MPTSRSDHYSSYTTAVGVALRPNPYPSYPVSACIVWNYTEQWAQIENTDDFIPPGTGGFVTGIAANTPTGIVWNAPTGMAQPAITNSALTLKLTLTDADLPFSPGQTLSTVISAAVNPPPTFAAKGINIGNVTLGNGYEVWQGVYAIPITGAISNVGSITLPPGTWIIFVFYAMGTNNADKLNVAVSVNANDMVNAGSAYMPTIGFAVDQFGFVIVTPTVTSTYQVNMQRASGSNSDSASLMWGAMQVV